MSCALEIERETPAAADGLALSDLWLLPLLLLVQVFVRFSRHLAKLKADGVKVIINLRPPGEHRSAEEEAEAKKAGLRYINIPVVYTDPKDEQADEFLKATDDPENRPAFIHCAAAIRVGAFWMIRRVLRDGWTIEKAEEEAKKVGLVNAPHLTTFAKNYIEKRGKK